MSPDFKYPKEIRLKSRKQIEALFQIKTSIFQYPLLIKYKSNDTLHDGGYSFRFAISVPKRNFARAVDRNLIRRRIKECIRLNWRQLLDDREIKPQDFLVIYVGKKIEQYETLNSAFIKALNGLE